MSRKNLILIYGILFTVWTLLFIDTIREKEFLFTGIALVMMIKNGYMIYRHNKNDKEIEKIIRTV